MKKAVSLIFILFYFILSIKSQDLTDCDNGKCFYIDSLSEHIYKTLTGHCMGFGFVIYKDGNIKKEVLSGNKCLEVDGAEERFDTFSKMHIASMSKTITAICVLRQLAHDRLNTYELIKDFLPADWKLGPNTGKITFRRLMRHEAGIRVTKNEKTNGELYSQLKGKIEEGVHADSMDVEQYQNMDFAMMRILLPRLAGFKLPKKNRAQFTADRYIEYVKGQVFKTCELADANTFPSELHPVHNYKWPYKGGHGQLFYDYTLSCGAYGWYLSVSDYGKIINKLFNSEELLDSAWRDTMTTNHLGCYPYKGKNGEYYWHNGEWTWADGNGNGSANTCWMYFPNNVIVVAMVNSDIPGWFPDILAHAYDKAWVKE
jgi:CubicO group peptidase (beta-lactamase class C family)